MNYITLNGVRNDSVPGLLICSFPPITKPKMRTQIDTVDGRAGDIVTDLGYEAYDRDVVIGLHGTFNIDDVIRYFNSSGMAVFSNEPNKVYTYTITAEINLERLIRFRTATVTFHVQPYKFSATESPITKAITSETYLDVVNSGNVPSAPIITVYGEGNVGLSLNGAQIFAIAIGDDGYITINTDEMNAYKDGVLKNRQVTGNYDNFVLSVGTNRIEWSGTVTEIDIDRYSRWI